MFFTPVSICDRQMWGVVEFYSNVQKYGKKMGTEGLMCPQNFGS